MMPPWFEPKHFSAIILGLIAIFTAKDAGLVSIICAVAACTILGGC